MSLKSDAAALRDARRKRILENSESRLQKIIGNTDVSVSKPNNEAFSTEPRYNIQVKRTEVVSERTYEVTSGSLPNNLEETLQHLRENISPHITEETREPNRTLAQQQSSLDSIIFMRLHYVLLALLVHTFLFFNLGYLFYNNVLCPFYTLKIVEWYYKSPVETSPKESMFLAVLLLSGISANTINTSKKWLTFGAHLVADFSMYFFTFLILHEFIYKYA